MRAWRQVASQLSERKVISSAVLIPPLAEVQADSLLGANSDLWVACPATQDIPCLNAGVGPPYVATHCRSTTFCHM